MFEKNPRFQDFKGQKNKNAPIADDVFKNETGEYNQKNPITKKKIGDFQSTHAAHRLAFNIKDVEFQNDDSEQAKALKSEIKNLLATTDLLPGPVNLNHERLVDGHQKDIVGKFLNEEPSKQSDLKFFELIKKKLKESFLIKLKLRDTKANKQVWNSYLVALGKIKSF